MSQSRDSRPTVCQVLHSLGLGGAEVLAAQIARRLSDRYRFVFACLDELGVLGEQLRQDGFSVEVLNRQPGIDWRCAVRLSHFVRRERAAVIHSHQYTPFFQALLSRLAYRRPPVVFTEHGRHYPDHRSLKRVAFNRALLRGDDRLIGVGESVCDALIANEGFASRRVERIYNGVDLQRFAEAPASSVAMNESFSGRPVILHVARLNALKDHETALRAFARLRDHGVPAQLVLVGDGETRPQLERFIAQHGLADGVCLLGARRDIPQLMAAADVCLLSSISEGIPLTLIEAMAAQRPVVATDVGGVSEVVIHGETGLLAPARDDEQLARHLRTLLNNKPLREQYGRAGADRAQRLFSLDQMLESYATVYDETLGLRCPSRPALRTTPGNFA